LPVGIPVYPEKTSGDQREKPGRNRKDVKFEN
jgi:hypothetical protein